MSPDRPEPPLEVAPLKEKREPKPPLTWKSEFARLNRSYEYHLSFGLQAVAFFYAAVGGVLSLYFGGDQNANPTGNAKSRLAISILLLIPICMSLVLGYYLARGAWLQREDADHMRRIAEGLDMERPPKVELLTQLLTAFSVLFFFTSIGLSFLFLQVNGVGRLQVFQFILRFIVLPAAL